MQDRPAWYYAHRFQRLISLKSFCGAPVRLGVLEADLSSEFKEQKSLQEYCFENERLKVSNHCIERAFCTFLEEREFNQTKLPLSSNGAYSLLRNYLLLALALLHYLPFGIGSLTCKSTKYVN